MRNFKVAIFGTAASYHDLAAREFYGQEFDLVECTSFRQCCELLTGNHADYAVMAIENSLAGSILSNYNLVSEFGLRIIGEQYLKVELHLLALEGVALKDVRYIRSHPMALAQCQDFLNTLTDVRIIESGDTASCVRNLRENALLDTAVVANERAAELYQVPVLVKNIGNKPHNYTRFLVLSKGDLKPEHPNKASLCFRLNHEVGSLADVLAMLKRSRVSLSKIQSVPLPDQPHQYAFHTDVEWECYEDFRKALKKIKRSTSRLEVLGEYVRSGVQTEL